MVVKKYLLSLGFLMLLSAVGCSHSPPTKSHAEEAEGRAVTNEAAREANAHDFVEIEFRQGSAMLTESAKSSLSSVLKQARESGTIDEVIVLSWSDSNFPSKNLKKLPKEERELAEKRNKSVAEYVKTQRSVDVNSYNMAERPTAFSKLFNTADSKLKNSFLAAGLTTTADQSEYASKASRSVVLVKLK